MGLFSSSGGSYDPRSNNESVNTTGGSSQSSASSRRSDSNRNRDSSFISSSDAERSFNDSANDQAEADARTIDAGNIGGGIARFGAGMFGPIGAALAPLAERGGYYAGRALSEFNPDGSWPSGMVDQGSGSGSGSNSQGYSGGLQGGYPGAVSGSSPGQTEMNRQDAFLQYAGGLYHPSMQRGEQASSDLFNYYAADQKPMQERVNQSVMDSPFLAQNITQGENAIARNQQATGGFRSGTTQENLAQNSQNQYQNLYNQQLNQNLQGLGMFSDYGANALNNYSDFGRGMINDIGTTSGNIQSQNIAQEAYRRNEDAAKKSAIYGALASGIGSYFGS